MGDPQKIIDSLKLASKDPLLKFVFIPLLWFLKFIYWVLIKIPRLHVMHLLMSIEKLERQEKFNEARTLRELWLKKRRYSRFAELWFSEGKDLLYNKRKPQKALSAFENAIQADAFFSPIELYYGASCAALMTNQYDKAEKHYQAFNRCWDKFMKNPKLKGYYFTNYLGCKNWLDKNIKRSKS